jgi:hypothetical protein
MTRIVVLFSVASFLLANPVFAYTDEDLFPLRLPDEEPDEVVEKEPVYDERYDPELWYVSLVKLWEMYETVPYGKVLKASFEATRGMDYVVIIRGKGMVSFLRTPYDTSIYSPLEDPLIEAKIDEAIGDDEAIYNYLHNAKENGNYSIRIESRTGDRERLHIEVFIVHKSRRIRIEEEEDEDEIEERGATIPGSTGLTIDKVEE